MKSWIRKAHRWLGLAFSLTLLMSSGSGVLHVVMTRTQAAPPTARPTGQGLDTTEIRINATDAAAKTSAINPGKPVVAINIRNISGQPFYQIFHAGNIAPQYVNAVDGNLDPDADVVYASQIASAFLGGGSVRKTDYLTAFNNEYINIFRILPVHRFDAGDGKNSRVYVSTTTGSVTRHTDDSKQLEASVFTNFHKFGFIPDKDARDWILSIITGATFLISLLGIALFFLTRPRKKSRRTEHPASAP